MTFSGAEPAGREVEEEAEKGELQGVDLCDGGVEPEDEAEGKYPPDADGCRRVLGCFIDGQSQKEGGQCTAGDGSQEMTPTSGPSKGR